MMTRKVKKFRSRIAEDVRKRHHKRRNDSHLRWTWVERYRNPWARSPKLPLKRWPEDNPESPTYRFQPRCWACERPMWHPNWGDVYGACPTFGKCPGAEKTRDDFLYDQGLDDWEDRPVEKD